MSGDIFGCYWGGRCYWPLIVKRPGLLLNTLQCTGHPTQEKGSIGTQMLVAWKPLSLCVSVCEALRRHEALLTFRSLCHLPAPFPLLPQGFSLSTYLLWAALSTQGPPNILGRPHWGQNQSEILFFTLSSYSGAPSPLWAFNSPAPGHKASSSPIPVPPHLPTLSIFLGSHLLPTLMGDPMWYCLISQPATQPLGWPSQPEP